MASAFSTLFGRKSLSNKPSVSAAEQNDEKRINVEFVIIHGYCRNAEKLLTRSIPNEIIEIIKQKNTTKFTIYFEHGHGYHIKPSPFIINGIKGTLHLIKLGRVTVYNVKISQFPITARSVTLTLDFHEENGRNHEMHSVKFDSTNWRYAKVIKLFSTPTTKRCICDVDIVNIEYIIWSKTNNMIMFEWVMGSDQNKKLFIPQFGNGYYRWNMNDYFNLSVAPNGYNKNEKGSCKVRISLKRFPEGIKSATFKTSLKSNHRGLLSEGIYKFTRKNERYEISLEKNISSWLNSLPHSWIPISFMIKMNVVEIE